MCPSEPHTPDAAILIRTSPYSGSGTSIVSIFAGDPDDTADAFFDYYLTFNRWDVEPAIARRFCDRALPTMTWLTELGVVFPVEGLYRAGLEPAPRSHRPTGGGAAIVEALRRAV